MSYPSETSSALDLARQERLKEAHAYYLFQPASLGRLRRLSRTTLWMSDPGKFNDPLDSRFEIKDLSYRGPFGDETRRREAMRVLIQDNPDTALHWFYTERLLESIKHWIDGRLRLDMLIDDIRMRFREFGVACFTPIWNNTLMWSHYADGHAGYCIEYGIGEMTLATGNQGMFSAFHVQYVKKLPELCVDEALFTPAQTIDRMLASKSAEWAYEQEWRLVHLEKKASYVDIPEGMEISALIAGLKASHELLGKLTRKADSLKVPAYRIRRASGGGLKMELL